jgi:hypothetical protein
VIEPLLALLAPAANHVLLLAAAIAPNRGVILLIGRSRSGKSSLSARAATEGIAVLGDDHVLVGRDGTCRSFPRRLRPYTDLQETAPHAYRNLPGSQRVLLAAFRIIRAVTRGAVAPPLRVPIEALGPVARDTLPLGLVVVIELGDNGRLERSDLDSNALVEVASMILREQRTALLRVPDPVWAERLDEVQRNEAQLLQTASAGVRSALRLTVPTAWDARRRSGSSPTRSTQFDERSLARRCAGRATSPEPSRLLSKPPDAYGSIRLRGPRLPVFLQCSCSTWLPDRQQERRLHAFSAAPWQRRVNSRVASRRAR